VVDGVWEVSGKDAKQLVHSLSIRPHDKSGVPAVDQSHAAHRGNHPEITRKAQISPPMVIRCKFLPKICNRKERTSHRLDNMMLPTPTISPERNRGRPAKTMKTKSSLRHFLVLAAAGLLFAPLSSHAAVVISQFNFTGNSAASSDTEPITSTTSITRGAGISGTTFANDRMEIRGNETTATNSNNTLATQQPPAIAADDYVTFTVTIPAGYFVSLTSFDYKWATQDLYRQSFGIYSDKTGFTYANILDGLHVGGSSSTGGSMTAFTARSIDLSEQTSLQNLTDTTVEFRFYIAHPQSGSSLRAWAFDDIELSGTVELIPEPAAALLGGLGFLMLLRRRR